MLYHIQTSKFQRYMVAKSRFRINTAQKLNFPLKISAVNVTKSAVFGMLFGEWVPQEQVL